MALIFLSPGPQIPIINIIGINIASKKIKNINKFRVQNTFNIKNSKNKKFAAYSFIDSNVCLYTKVQLYKKHNGNIKVVNNTKKKDIPSIPKAALNQPTVKKQ